ncbi:MAG TPA: formylglycine-generating enzyme family protein [Blastocatellia bacterium]|jgi:formylglycine-generating enzyme required for sulfatase activity|nr:formylglycine-generating enzyme family protein [Blastocatellia bacterium]
MFNIKWITSFSLAVAALLSGFAQADGVNVKAGADSESTRQVKFIPAGGSRTDAATGLPTRVVHKESGIALVLIPAGEFQMGSPPDEVDHLGNERQHRRVISKPFYLGETEVTVEQFRRFVRATNYQTDAERGVEEGGNAKGAFAATPDGDRQWAASASWRNPFPNLKEYRASDGHPVVHVSWNDAMRFVEHFGLRLPTEAQWEYAARAGSRTRFFWGDGESGGKGYGNVKDDSSRKRFRNWNSSFPFGDGILLLSAVGKYRPNAWKVYDVVGNVSEWCRDAYQKDYPGDGADERATEGDGNAPRVIRGGSWLDAPDLNRSAKRIGFYPQGRRDFIGFRVAATAESVK